MDAAIEELSGEIQVGDRLVWEPDNPKAFARVIVTALRDGQVELEVEGLEPGDANGRAIAKAKAERNWMASFPGSRAWNDECRVREACVRTGDYDAGKTRAVGREAIR